MKIVINKQQAGLELSRKATEALSKMGEEEATTELKPRKAFIYGGTKELLAKMQQENNRKHKRVKSFKLHTMCRSNFNLVKVVEDLGEQANGDSAELEVVEIPDGTDWIISFDKYLTEHVAENHRRWGQ